MKMNRCASMLAVLLCVAAVMPLRAQSLSKPIVKATPEQLRRWLETYPEADANRDGTLTVEEADAYRQKLDRRQKEIEEQARPAFPHEYTQATMSDGVKIALAVGYPKGFDAADTQRKWPAVFSTSGYPMAVVPASPAAYGDRYVTVQASIRGTGASGGALSPWDARTWQDGYEILEEWIAKQPWSNGKVGIHGYSWPGLMGFLTAATQPPSLKAVCVGGLIDDFYRGIARPGGIPNVGFPIDWINQFYRLDGPFGSGAAAQVARGLDDAAYGAIVASRPRRDLTQDTLWMGLHEPFDGPRWQQQSLSTHAPRIRAPILIGHAWQDEQTGPTGWQLWRRVPEDLPKRLFLTNGNHGVAPVPHAEIVAWFDRWLLDKPNEEAEDPQRRVQCYFETRKSPEGGAGILGKPLSAADFPLPTTTWNRYYLQAGNRLSPSMPGPRETTDSYAVLHNERGSEAHVTYLIEFDQPTAVCGPAVLTFWAQLTTLDTDFYVLIADQSPDGELFGLQRGLLRASHREVDPEQSEYVLSAGRKALIRPHHPHTRVEPVTPHEPCEFQIEIPAFGHIFRPGHKLALFITRPPEGDWIGVTRAGTPSYRYDSHPPTATVTILRDANHPSNLLLPVLAQLPPIPAEPVPLEQQAGLKPIE